MKIAERVDRSAVVLCCREGCATRTISTASKGARSVHARARLSASWRREPLRKFKPIPRYPLVHLPFSIGLIWNPFFGRFPSQRVSCFPNNFLSVAKPVLIFLACVLQLPAARAPRHVFFRLDCSAARNRHGSNGRKGLRSVRRQSGRAA